MHSAAVLLSSNGTTAVGQETSLVFSGYWGSGRAWKPFLKVLQAFSFFSFFPHCLWDDFESFKLKNSSSVNMQMQPSSPDLPIRVFPDVGPASWENNCRLLSIDQWNFSLWQEEKNVWKFSICSHRSFYISRRASQHNCSQLVAICQSYYGHHAAGQMFLTTTVRL